MEFFLFLGSSLVCMVFRPSVQSTLYTMWTAFRHYIAYNLSSIFYLARIFWNSVQIISFPQIISNLNNDYKIMLECNGNAWPSRHLRFVSNSTVVPAPVPWSRAPWPGTPALTESDSVQSLNSRSSVLPLKYRVNENLSHKVVGTSQWKPSTCNDLHTVNVQ